MPEAADSNPRENMISKVVEQEKLGEEKLVIIRRKEAKDSQECSNFRTGGGALFFERPPPPPTPSPPKTNLSLGLCQALREWQGMFFSFRDSPWNIVAQCIQQIQKHQINL